MQAKMIEKRMEENRVAIQHLEMQLVNVACDDPGIAIGSQLILPALQVGTRDPRGPVASSGPPQAPQ
jgi:hypothetical protein